MRFSLACPLILVLGLMAGPAAADPDVRNAQLGDCSLESGAIIHDCIIAYRIMGELNQQKSNVIVFPTWYNGSTADLLENGFIGPGALVDTDRYQVIAVESFGNGLSSSPSNSPRQAGENFPRFTLRDMVTAQHRLLTEQLGFDQVFAVAGISMGGMQAFEWMVSHPAFMEKIVAIEGTPWPSAYDLLLWGAWRDASFVNRGDPDSLQLEGALQAKLGALTLWTPRQFNTLVEPAALDTFLQGFTGEISPQRMLDRRYQTFAMLEHDIRRSFRDPVTEIPAAVRAKVLVVVFEQDHMVNPAPSLELAEMIGARARVFDSPCGHMSPSAACILDEIRSEVSAFLE